MAFRNGLYTRKNTGWENDFTTAAKITYKPKNPDELLGIHFVTIDNTGSGLYTCSISTEKYYRANQIIEDYHRRGGSKDEIYDALSESTTKVFKKRNAEEIGLLLRSLSAFHEFDKDSKKSLLNFIKLNDFPERLEPALSSLENCTIS